MAFSRLHRSKDPVGREHDAFNVSHVHDPQHTQHGIVPDATMTISDANTNAVVTAPEPMIGTAAELRQRTVGRLKGSFRRSRSAPLAPADRAPKIPDDSASPRAPEESVRADASQILWTAERLDDLDEHVHGTIHSRLQNLEWRVSNIDSRISHMIGDPTFPDQQDIRRKRYGM